MLERGHDKVEVFIDINTNVEDNITIRYDHNSLTILVVIMMVVLKFI